MKYLESSAAVSGCGLYRYDLHRTWRAGLPTCLFVMLNPSTANGAADDPTIRRCVGFADAWGYGGLTVVNLFAYRATSPAEMLRAADPVGPDGDEHVRLWALAAGLIVAAWGTHGGHRGRAGQVRRLLAGHKLRVHHLGLTKDGHPRHPLYLPADLRPTLWPEG